MLEPRCSPSGTVPKGILKAHTTKQGPWALIHVLEGRLAYRISDPRWPPWEEVLLSDDPPGVVNPTIVHEVEPLGPVRFFVEFHRLDAATLRGAQDKA